MSKRHLLSLLTLAGALAAAACGTTDERGEGGKTVRWYVFNEPGGAFDQAAKSCSDRSRGRYRIEYARLPTDANQQRELVARRLAAKDSDIDIVGMDVIWTAEFAEAGWIRPWGGARRAAVTEGVLPGPLSTVRYRGEVFAAPFTTNTQLLWYRKDRVKAPPRTWEEMIAMAKRRGTKIEVQAARYEGLTVWFNSLVASAGGSIVDEEGNVKLGAPATGAARVMRALAASPAAPPGLSNNREDQARLGFEEGRSDFQVNYTFIYASAAEKKGFQEKIAWAPWPDVAGGGPSRVTLGGINLGVGSYSKNPELAFEAAQCLARPENQVVATEKGGLPPTSAALYDDPRIRKAFPFADLLKETIASGVPRPVNPAYSDISLAISQTLHPPEDLEPSSAIEELRDRLDKAAEGKIF